VSLSLSLSLPLTLISLSYLSFLFLSLSLSLSHTLSVCVSLSLSLPLTLISLSCFSLFMSHSKFKKLFLIVIEVVPSRKQDLVSMGYSLCQNLKLANAYAKEF
jgi:hypothetical protein